MIVVKDRVRFVETDLMGVVHHSNYFRWFEMGRVEYLRQCGINILELNANNIVCPIVDVSCKYKASAFFDDTILIKISLIQVSRAKMVFSYVIERETDAKVLAEGQTTNLFTNSEGKIVRIDDFYYNKLKNMFDKLKKEE